MPRILNAKQTSAAAGNAKLPHEGSLYGITSATGAPLNVIDADGTLVASAVRLLPTPVRFEPTGEGGEEGTYTIFSYFRELYVQEGRRPNPVKVGPGEPVVVRISPAGDGLYIIKALYEDLVWTLVEEPGPLHQVVKYEPSNGDVTQLWSIRESRWN